MTSPSDSDGKQSGDTRSSCWKGVWKYEYGETQYCWRLYPLSPWKVIYPVKKAIKAVREVGYAMQDALEWIFEPLEGFEYL